MANQQVEETLQQAKNLLAKIDAEIDKLEGADVHTAMLAIQEYLLEWNLLGHNFTTSGIQDWLQEPSK